MARLTQGKMDRWERDIAKAQVIMRRVHREQGEVLQSSTGGRLSDLQRASRAANVAVGHLAASHLAAVQIQQGEARRKPKRAASCP